MALLHDQFLAGEPLAATEVVRFELLSGVRDGELSATERLILAFDWLPVTESVARLAGDLATWRLGKGPAILELRSIGILAYRILLYCYIKIKITSPYPYPP